MRVIFIGVVDAGWHCLEAVLEIKANVVGIFTADKQRMVEKSGMHPDYFREFDDLARQWGVPLYKIDNVSVPFDTERMKGLKPDLIFCIGWPQVIGKEILGIPSCSCIGIHPTLLPERRGGAPINWCLIDGLSKSGVTLFYFDEGIDSGDIIAQQEFEITLEDTAKTVLDKVANISVELIKEYYPFLEKGDALRISQDNTRATYTRRRRPEDGVIDWRKTSLSIYNWIRALTLPFPGAFTFWNGRKIIIWESELLKGYRARFNARHGEILVNLDERGMVVTTGDNCILIRTVEVDGEKMNGDEFVRRFKVDHGSILGGL